ncbi:hypothetical protein DSECCO2_636960 [anaerobic digester metagenome]
MARMSARWLMKSTCLKYRCNSTIKATISEWVLKLNEVNSTESAPVVCFRYKASSTSFR